MNKYLVFVTGHKDSLGFDFMKNVIELANKGAKLCTDKIPTLRFPHSCWMEYHTEEVCENKPGFQFQEILRKFNKEELEAMEWEELKNVCRKVGITHRDRKILITRYLQKIEVDAQSVA
ncbi:hypothetical protein D3C85_1093310 [compost metagenome]